MQEGDIIPSSVAQWDCTEKKNKNTLLLPAKAGYCFSSDSKRKTLDYSLVFWGFSVYLKCCAVGVQRTEWGEEKFHST